ncbi:MAG: hypothetical protein AB1749_06935 [Pseudomonadota bacterium]
MQLESPTLEAYTRNLRRIYWIEFIERELDRRFLEQQRQRAEQAAAANEDTARPAVSPVAG